MMLLKKFAGNVLRVILLGLIILPLTGLFLFLTVPKLLPLETPQNVVFFSQDKQALQSVFLVYFNPDKQELVINNLDLQTPVDYIQNDQIVEVSLKEAYQNYAVGNHAARSQALFSWVLNRKIDQTIQLPAELLAEQNEPLSQWLKKRLGQAGSVSDLVSRARLYFYAKKVGPAVEKEFKPNQPAEVFKKDCAIVVLNTTEISGLAAKVSSLIEQSGGKVIRTDSYQPVRDQTAIYIDNSKEQCSQLGKSVAEMLLQPPVLPKDSDQKQDLLNRYRADIVILLGQDN